MVVHCCCFIYKTWRSTLVSTLFFGFVVLLEFSTSRVWWSAAVVKKAHGPQSAALNATRRERHWLVLLRTFVAEQWPFYSISVPRLGFLQFHYALLHEAAYGITNSFRNIRHRKFRSVQTFATTKYWLHEQFSTLSAETKFCWYPIGLNMLVNHHKKPSALAWAEQVKTNIQCSLRFNKTKGLVFSKNR